MEAVTEGYIKKIKDGQLIAFDQDDDAFRNDIDDERFTLVRQNLNMFKMFFFQEESIK